MAKCYKQEPKPQFDPIVLVLETQEEADVVWHRLNIGTSQTFDVYRESFPINSVHLNSTDLWRALNNMHQPER